MNKNNTDPINLIQCGDHLWAPYSIVCIHLLTGKSREWELIPIAEDDGREIDGDWLCPDCMNLLDEISDTGRQYTDHEMDNLRPVCIHCCRKLRKKFDPKYVEIE